MISFIGKYDNEKIITWTGSRNLFG